MFIAFEGIDGSGKTTLSNRLARRLRDEGHRVSHAREGGELPCPIARALRVITRDAANLELSELGELLLHAARDAQLLERVIRPALARGEIAISDRYLYSPLSLGVHGRGLPAPEVRAVLDVVAAGLWPDLVVVVDVEPGLARLRKRASKLGSAGSAPGRKGLSGSGLLHRLRQGLLALAAAEPARFLVVENRLDTTLQALEERIHAEVLARLPAAPKRGPSPQRLPPPVLPAPVSPARFDTAAPGAEARLGAAFLAAVQEHAGADPAAAALLLGRVSCRGAEELREQLAARAPAAVLRALGSWCSDEASGLRERLCPAEPRAVAQSLGGATGPRAAALRKLLAPAFPLEIAASLAGLAGPEVESLREQLFPVARAAVLRALAGAKEPAAWRLRELAGEAGAPADELLPSLGRLDDAESWALRRELLGRGSPLAQLRSVAGCSAEPAWALRERWLTRAPRPVLRGLAGLEDDRALELRERAGPFAKEALDSLAGLGGSRTLQLRRTLSAIWPVSAVASLEGLGSPEASELLWELVRCYGADAWVLRGAALCLTRVDSAREAA